MSSSKAKKKTARAKANVEGFDLPTPKARTKPAPRKVEAFVGKGQLRRDEPGERVTLYLPPQLITFVRMRCVQDRRSMSDAGTEAFQLWLDAQKKST